MTDLTIPMYLEPGVHYDVDEDDYHADPCKFPSVSASAAHTLIEATPRHAWQKSKRLNPHYEDDKKEAFDIGDAFHERLLRAGQQEIEVVDKPDWRTKAAQEARAKAYEEGKTPLLKKHDDRLQIMEREVVEQLTGYGMIDAWNEGKSEVTLVWEAGGCLNRCRVDKLDEKHRIAWDLKTHEGFADPQDWVRTSMNFGIDIRTAHYRDGLSKCLGPGWSYRYLIAEKKPPHLTSIVELSDGDVFMGAEKLCVARAIWANSVERNEWRGWPKGVAVVEGKHFFRTNWEEQKARIGAPDEVLKLAFEVVQ